MFYQNPKAGEVYNLGGGRENSCSILEAIELVQRVTDRKLDYEILDKARVGDHIWWISNNNKFMFLPKTPETLSRVVVEARMMGIKTITNKNVGASYESWFSLKGKELISHMHNKRTEIPNIIREII